MRTIIRTVFALLATAIASSAVAQEKATSPERRYCTQFGPFFIKFDEEKAAGVFAILNNGDMGAMVGPLNGNRFAGEWFEVDSGGNIEIEFSDDWASFVARYNVRANPDKWYENWLGRLPPDDVTDQFEADGVSYRCR